MGRHLFGQEHCIVSKNTLENFKLLIPCQKPHASKYKTLCHDNQTYHLHMVDISTVLIDNYYGLIHSLLHDKLVTNTSNPSLYHLLPGVKGKLSLLLFNYAFKC
jgi:hypothetical protein